MVRHSTFFVAFVACVFFFAYPYAASAVFYNDSNVIEIGDGDLPQPDEIDSNDPSDTENSPTNESETDTTSENDTSSSNPSAQNGTDEASSNGTTNSNAESDGESSVGGGAASTSTSSDTSSTVTEDTVIHTLLESGALAGVTSGGGTVAGVGGNSTLQGQSVVTGGLGGGTSASLNVTVDGDKVRESLRGKYDLQDILQSWRERASGRSGAREYGLVAASTALRDTNVEAVSFTASTFELTYRSRGYLLAVIPWSLPVRVTIVPAAPVVDERVKVRLPWYRFFMRTFFSRDTLAQEIDAVVITAVARGTVTEDGTILVFEEVSSFLKKKVGTIQDSILLGTAPAS